MPIVRIDLIEGKSEESRVEVGEIVYQTLVGVLNVPKGDRFQVITEHCKSALSFDRDYLGVLRVARGASRCGLRSLTLWPSGINNSAWSE